MNIIFGSDNAERLSDKYTVLELDTFKFIDQENDVVAYCVIEAIPLDELAETAEHKEQHATLVESYKTQQWDACKSLIEALRGRWSGEMDSYYENLLERVDGYVENSPGEDWSFVIVK